MSFSILLSVISAVRKGLLPLILLFSGSAMAQSAGPSPAAGGYEIDITLTPFQNQKIYLGSYYGKYKKLADSTMVDALSRGSFRGSRKLTPGLYFLVSPGKTILFDLMIDSLQHMRIIADSAYPDQARITGSPDNDLYQQYTRFLSVQGPILAKISADFKTAKNAADSQRLIKAYEIENKKLNDFRKGVMDNHPHSMLAMFFHALKKPEPEKTLPLLANGKQDSLYPFRFSKEHFWDDINFSDDRLLYTPFFDQRVEEYYKSYVFPEADSIIPEVNYMLLSAREGKEMFNYLLGRFTDEYINPKIMGQDKVFVFLFNNFFSKGDTTFLNERQRKFIFDRAYSLMANQIGEAAAPMELRQPAGNPASLYNLQAPFTFVAFWDHNCGHCKEQIPRIDSIYQAKWKKLGVKIFSVNTNEKLHGDAGSLPAALKEWNQFLTEKNISKEWMQAYQPEAQRKEEQGKGLANYRQLYDVYQTPTFYLLDRDKRIIGKKLTLEQFDGLIEAKRAQTR